MMTNNGVQRRKWHGGFTVLELMVIVVIVALLASVAIPSFTNMIRNNRMTAQSNELLSMAYLARSEAVKRRETVSFEMKPVSGGGWEAEVTAGSETLRVLDHSTSPVELVCGASCTVEFTSRGHARGSTTLELTHDPCADGQARRIRVEQSGRVFIEEDRSCPAVGS